jgi:Spy/CpxP family protein refolding chaperone
MRAITRILLSTFLLAGALWAQTTPAPSDNSAPPPHKMMRQHNGIDAMAQQLNLNDQQKTQIQGIFQTQRQQAQAIRQDTSLTPEQKQEKLKALRASTHQQVEGVLTPEQQQQMKQLRAQHEGMGKGMGRGAANGMGPLSRLNLTPDQRAKIEPIMKSTREQAQAVRNDTSLTPEQKQAKMREIHQGAMTQVNSLLTPEQQQQMQNWRQHRGPGGKQATPPATPPSGF